MNTNTSIESPKAIYRLPPEKAAPIRTNPPHNMSVMEAAAYIGVSPRKIRDLIARQRLKHARVGSRIVLRRTYLDELVEPAV